MKIRREAWKRATDRISTHMTASQIMVAGFAILIFAGGLLLSMPFCNADGKWLNFLDALFTACSAVCVTGLVTITPAMQFTLAGKLILLLLIQLGGLGIIACTMGAFLILKKQITIRSRVMIQDSYDLHTMSGVVAMLRYVLHGTFAVEGIGAVLYAIAFIPKYGVLRGLWYGVFHSVSAFCNAGFDILGTTKNTFPSLLQYAGNALVNVVIMLLIIIGGIESIAVVCEKLVPLMALFYVVGCIVILCANYDFLLPALKAIFVLAFKPGAVTGGLVGGGIRLALQYGVARGLFSNESGMGSAPLVASAAQTRNPVRQALVSATGTFWTTVVVCLMTGLVLVSSMMKNPAVSVENMANGGQMTTAAFAQIPYIGPLILMVSIITFAYSTILGWSYYGERAAEYLLGKKAILPYKVLFIAVVVCAPVLALDLVWTIADVLNAFMAIPNLIAVLLLSGVIAAETKHYLKHLD